ncbi:S8 family serine peptidase, partial [Phyllobacterium myrsinacearum]
MFFHATGAAFSARSDCLSKFRNHLMSSVCAALIIAASGSGAHAQDVPGKYFNADGSKTDDLEKAAATWRNDPEFRRNFGVGAMKTEYAYARGLSGAHIKLGVFDNGTWRGHSEFADPGKLETITTTGTRAYTDPYVLAAKQSGNKGDPFVLDGGDSIPWASRSIYHGTGVAGIVGALRNGKGMHGIAFNSSIVAASNGDPGPEDGIVEGNDENIYRAGFDALINAGVRGIVNSWGIGYDEKTNGINLPPPLYRVGTKPYKLSDGIAQYYSNPTHGTYAAAEKVARAGIVQVFAAGNDYGSEPESIPGLPYFRPDIEANWITVVALTSQRSPANYTNFCGYTKWYCVSAPGHLTNTSSFNGGGDKKIETYEDFTGTSAAAPHVLGALGLVFERFHYLTNAQARDVLLTTSNHLGTGDANTPDKLYGWGLIDLQKAMNGPGQFMGRFDANLGAGVRDTWSNDISQVALDQRKREEAEEVAAWAARKKAQGWESGIGEKQRSELAKIIEPKFSSDKLTTAEGLLANLFKAVAANATTKVNLDVAFANSKIKADPLAKVLLADFTKAYPKAVTTYGTDPSLDYAAYKTNRKDDPLAVLKQSMLAELMMPLETEYQFTETRTAYLSGKLADVKSYDAGLTKSGAGSLWLTGKNSYRGDTVINGGELGIGLGGSIISASVINDTGLLTVDGTAAAVTANAGGRLKINTTGV